MSARSDGHKSALSNERKTVLNVKRASVVRADRHLLRDISFSLEAGQVMALLGANGAGKSTLLSALAHDIALTGGSIAINGTRIENLDPESLAEVRALNAVEPPLAFSLSVFEYLSLGRPFAEVDCAAILQTLEQCHATQWMNRDAASLSSGELLRVQLARSLYQLGQRERCVWLLDEPLAHLDLAQRQFALQLLRDVATERKWSIVFSTHDPRDAERIADVTLLLKNGTVAAAGRTKDSLNARNLEICFGVVIEYQQLPRSPD
jgi:iron complex transport system ATP-binding protein